MVALRLLGGDGVFTAYNEEPNWRKAHELLMPAFTQSAMRRYHPVMLEAAAQPTDSWDSRAGRETSTYRRTPRGSRSRPSGGAPPVTRSAAFAPMRCIRSSSAWSRA